MVNPYPKTFRTKTGICEVLPDQIVLSREGLKGSLAKALFGNSITHALIIYGIMLVLVLYFALESYGEGKIIEAILFVFLAFYLFYGLARSRNISTDSMIVRSRITEVKFYKAVPKLTRSRFEVYFKNENDRIKKRVILLPGSLSKGEKATEIALRIMREEKLLIV